MPVLAIVAVNSAGRGGRCPFTGSARGISNGFPKIKNIMNKRFIIFTPV